MAKNGKTLKSRRKTLKAMAIGSAGVTAATAKSLPERWGKPVVDSVVLPGHAKMTKKMAVKKTT